MKETETRSRARHTKSLSWPGSIQVCSALATWLANVSNCTTNQPQCGQCHSKHNTFETQTHFSVPAQSCVNLERRLKFELANCGTRGWGQRWGEEGSSLKDQMKTGQMFQFLLECFPQKRHMLHRLEDDFTRSFQLNNVFHPASKCPPAFSSATVPVSLHRTTAPIFATCPNFSPCPMAAFATVLTSTWEISCFVVCSRKTRFCTQVHTKPKAQTGKTIPRRIASSS